MKQVRQGLLPRAGMGFVLLLAGTGCATTSDLEKLDQGISRKLEAQDKRTQVEMNRLRSQLNTVQTAQEKQQRETVRKLDELWSTVRTESENLHLAVEALHKDLTAETTNTRKILDEFVEKSRLNLERIESSAGEVRVQMSALNQTLLGTYRFEEAALRERLKTLEQLKKQLEPVSITQQTVPETGK